MASFISKTLEQGETVIFQGRLHWTYNWKLLLCGCALIAASIAGAILLRSKLSDGLAVVIFLIVLAVTGLGMLGWSRFIRTKTEFAITNSRFIQKDGIFNIKITEIPLFKVETVNFHQNIGQRILGTGDIELVGSGGTSHRLNFVQHPHKVRNILATNMKENKSF